MSKKNIFVKDSPQYEDYASLTTPSQLDSFKRTMDENKKKKDQVNLNNLFGGKRGSKKSKGTKNSSRKSSKKRGSKKGSRKQSRNQSRNRSRKQSRNQSRKQSRKQSRSYNGGSRKNKRNTNNLSTSEQSREGSKKGINAPGMVAFRELAKYIADNLKEKYGPKIIKLASVYKKLVEEQNPGIGSADASRKAKDLFDKDSNETRKKRLNEAANMISKKKAKKNEAYSSTSDN